MLVRGVLIFLGIIFFSRVYGQTEKGGIMLGGSASAYHYKLNISRDFFEDTEVINSGFSLSPLASYFILDKLAVGIVSNYGFGINATKSQGHRSPNNLTTNLALGPNVRYYFPYRRFAVFPEFQYVGWLNLTKQSILNPFLNEYETSRSKNRSGDLQVGIGAAYFLTSNIALEGIFRLNRINSEGYHVGSAGTDIYSFNLGMQLFLNKKVTN